MTKIAYVITGVILTTVLIVLGINWKHSEWSVSAKSQPAIEQSKSSGIKVTALKIAEMKKDGDFIRVYLRNVSDKEINGLTLSFKDNSTITIDYTISGDGILPMELKEITVPAEVQIDSTTTNYILNRPAFEIVAVVFIDQTVEGDPKYISEIKDRRRGLKTQLEKILPELNKMSYDSESMLLSTLQETKRKTLVLPERYLNESHSFKQGLNDGKEDLLKIINDAMNQQGQKQADFEKVQKSLKEKIDKIKDRINRL